MERHGYGKLVKHHRDKRHANRSGKYHQSEMDREHDYDSSMKHRKRESEGMKKYHMEHSHRR